MSNVRKYRIPMFRDGQLVTLNDILRLVNGSGLKWHLMDIEAISRRDAGLDVLELEREVNASSDGRAFTDLELRALSRKLDQVIECRIVGMNQEHGPDNGRVPVVVISAFDSTEWILSVDVWENGRLDAGSPLLSEP